MSIDIEKCKFILEYFEPDDRGTISKYMDQIKYEGDNEEIIQCLCPVVVRIINLILTKRYSNLLDADKYQYLIMLVDVKHITNRFIDYCENFLPVAKSYFLNLDYQAELVSLFCDDYLFGLIERLKNSDIKLIRELKLRQLYNEI